MLDNLKKYKVILASNSPRRKELLAGLGVDYEVRTLPDVDESYPDTLQGADIPLYICFLIDAHYCFVLLRSYPHHNNTHHNLIAFPYT